MNKHYYIELYNKDDYTEYIMQSKWYEEERQALWFLKDIDYIDFDNYRIRLMSADLSTDDYDIVYEREISKEELKDMGCGIEEIAEVVAVYKATKELREKNKIKEMEM